MKLAKGFLLNVWLVFAEATNRSERRQKAKVGSFRRQ